MHSLRCALRMQVTPESISPPAMELSPAIGDLGIGSDTTLAQSTPLGCASFKINEGNAYSPLERE